VITITIITIPKPIERIVKTKPPIRSIVKPSIKWAKAPKGIVKRIIIASVKAPTIVKVSPRVIVDIVNFGFAGSVSPWGLRIYGNICIAIIVTGIILSVCIGVILWVV
jgi:hypothetical protein